MSIPSYRRKLGGYWYDIQYRSKEVSLAIKPGDEQGEIRGILRDAARAHKASQFADTLTGSDPRR